MTPNFPGSCGKDAAVSTRNSGEITSSKSPRTLLAKARDSGAGLVIKSTGKCRDMQTPGL
ncbi:hypothetical protein EDD52_102281 [Primorskyibacter sedentarius]|uniref:Uncharacterized protein n=1 Tax=Primorskyibacter sedentarius TaxID=745311 RepID=A0A4R3JJN0_9RHOB|nr:hypothetical protein EDD52_102281 [Primorskyibacter sedentarius]